MSNIRQKILDNLKEDWLNTQYDRAQSFYKKARTEEDGNKLYSYDTLVAEVKDGKPIIYNAQSQTTRRHIREFLLQKGFDYDEIYKAIDDFKKENGGYKPKVEESFDSVQYWGSVNQYNYTKRQLRVDYDNKTYEVGDFKWVPDHKVSNKEIDRKIEELKAAGFKEIKKGKVQESVEEDRFNNEDLNKLVRDEIKKNNGSFPETIEYKGRTYTCFNLMDPNLPKDGTVVYYCNMENTPSGNPQESNDYFFVNASLNLIPSEKDPLNYANVKFKGVREVNYIEDLTEGAKTKRPTKRLVMNQGNVYIFEQTKGSKKSYIVGEDIDKDANTIEKVNKYNNQDEAFTDFFARVGIDPNNELKESIKKATKSEVLTEADTYIYSNAESEDRSDAESMINAQYKSQFPKLKFRISKRGPMYCVDFIGKYQDICNALINLGWYNETEINQMVEDKIIKPLDESYKVFQQVKNGNEIESVEVDEVKSEEQAAERVSEIKAETGCGAYYKDGKEEPLKESGTLWTSETTEDDYDKDELKTNQYQDYLDEFDGTIKPDSYEEWLESDWLYNYLYHEFNNEDNEYNEWYDFINSYDEEDLKRYYQDYLDDIKEREPNKPKEFDDWFNDYMIDDSYDQWRFKEEDLKENVLPMIDKQVNGAIFITGDYHSNYPDFRKSGPGGKIVRDGDDLIDWLSEEDRVDISYRDDEQLEIAGYDHDGSISGLLYTLPDDPHKILEIALSTGYYDKNDYEDNNEIVEEFLEDLRNDNVNMRDIRKPDLLVPIVNGFRTGVVESIKEAENVEAPEYTQVYKVSDLDSMETGIPVAITYLKTATPTPKTALFAGKSDDKYYFYDEGGMFAFTKRYIEEEGNLLLTNGVDVTEVNRLNQSVNTEK